MGILPIIFFCVPIGIILIILVTIFAIKKKKKVAVCLLTSLLLVVLVPVLYANSDKVQFYMDVGIIYKDNSDFGELPFPKYTRYNFHNVTTSYSTNRTVDGVIEFYKQIADGGVVILQEKNDGAFKRVDIEFYYNGDRYTMRVSHGSSWLTGITIPIPEE
ncbi:MAG: hypothetical protein LBO63_01125 [Oscillospiraceae bacterium]|jgi:hypothetical protein|nr:hypothetical protein [Oscillospiraceae bacterium]